MTDEVPVEHELAAAVRATEAGDLTAALTALLNAWRSNRSPRVADVIDGISREITTTLPSLAAKPLSAQWKQWHEIAERADPKDFDRLVAVPLPRKWTDAQTHLEALYRWPADPRCARFLAKLVADCIFDPKPSDPRAMQVVHFYRRMMVLLTRLGDMRALPALEDPTPRPALAFGWWREDRAEHAKALRALTLPALTQEELACLEVLESRFAPRGLARTDDTAEGWMARIHASPEDRSLRAVLGDWSSERGDPRGELIQLQMSRADGRAATPSALKREAKLLLEHGRAWAGPLDGMFEAEGRVFVDGIFVGGTLTGSLTSLDEHLSEPAWRSVRVLELTSRVAVDSLRHENLRGVRCVKLAESSTAALCDRSWPFEEIIIDHWPDGAASLPSPHPLSDAESFPRLQALGVHDGALGRATAVLEWLPNAPVLRRLARVLLGVHDFAPWWEPLSRSPIAEVVVRPLRHIALRELWEHTFTRDERGELGCLRSRLHYRPRNRYSAEVDPASLLQALPPNALTRFTLEKSPAALKLPREPLERALARFPKLEVAD
ncbi:MAG: hypothetical protein U0271_38495 [Polyangiaceae bacterium]